MVAAACKKKNVTRTVNDAGLLRQLVGTWHIQFTNFPMWLTGKKRHPAFTYAAASSEDMLVDTVTYLCRGGVRRIRGKDRYLGGRRFRWRGSGLLCLLTSEWEVAHISSETDWAIVRFEKSLFSPAGHDIVARRALISADLENEMLSRFRSIFPGESIQRLASPPST